MNVVSENTEVLRNGIAEWLLYLAPSLDPVSSYTWHGNDEEQFWEFTRRAAIKRQWEGLEAILKMVDGGIGHFGVTLLRPAYEELIWIEYLDQTPDLAKRFIPLLVRHETAASLSAQNEFLHQNVMRSYGFTQRFIKVVLAHDREAQANIRKIGAQLGWNMNRSLLPSMSFLSRKVKREDEYKFLYHATSRFVHFSVQENLRRVWGKKGSVEISSSMFSAFWQDFSMYWAFRLFVELVGHCSAMLNPIEAHDEKHREMLTWLERFALIPVITRGELESWNKEGGDTA